jgi:uncharacterized YkwD family protein
MRRFIAILSVTIMAVSTSAYAGTNCSNGSNSSRYKCYYTTKCQINKPTQTTTETTTETTTQAEKPTETTTQAEISTETTTQAEISTETTTVSSMEQQVINLVNQERAKNGLSALSQDSALMNVAKLKSEDMKNNNYFSHTSPTYGSPFDMLKSFGISYKTAGENIAKGQKTAEAVVSAWMNSEGHRKNILNSAFTKIGVSYVDGYWTQIFTG